MATGRRIQLLLARFYLNQSTGQYLFWHFKLNATDKHSEAIAREENTQLPAAVHVSETRVLKLSSPLGRTWYWLRLESYLL